MTDFTSKAGNTCVLKFTITDQDTALPLNLTGSTIKFKAAQNAKIEVPEIERMTGGQGIVITDAPAGKCEVTIIPDLTLTFGKKLYYELDVIEASGRISTVQSGIWTIGNTLLRAADTP